MTGLTDDMVITAVLFAAVIALLILVVISGRLPERLRRWIETVAKVAFLATMVGLLGRIAWQTAVDGGLTGEVRVAGSLLVAALLLLMVVVISRMLPIAASKRMRVEDIAYAGFTITAVGLLGWVAWLEAREADWSRVALAVGFAVMTILAALRRRRVTT